MNTTMPPLDQELLIRTRKVDSKTETLLRLLDLLEDREGPTPLDLIREALTDILVEQRRISDSLLRIEQVTLPRPVAVSGIVPQR
ncbi:hypothetical protein [Bosea caraganae]|nr:hypothetical protein [Bosea caraganae]